MIKGKKILVTGGSGFIGSAVVGALLNKGAEVRVFDNHSRGDGSRPQLQTKACEIVTGDIRNFKDVRHAVQGVDSVLHLAYVNGTEYFYSKPELVLEVAVKGMMHIVDACIAESVGELILASSSEVYQTPPTIPTNEQVPLLVPDVFNPRFSYGGGKIISELLAVNYGRKHFEKMIIFRPHNVYGPHMGYEHVIPQFIERLRKLAQEHTTEAIPFPIQGSGKETRAFIYIDDFAQGLLTLLEKGEHMNIYHIGSDVEVAIGQLARMVADAMGHKIKIEAGDILEGSTLRRCPDISKIRELGFSPAVNLEEGIAKTVEWYLANPKP